MFDKIYNNLLKPKDESKEGQSLSTIALQLFIFISIVLIIICIKSILVPILFSAIIAILLFPLATRLEKWGVGRAVASIISVIIALIILVSLGYLIVNQVINIGKAGQDIVTKINAIINQTQSWIETRFHIKRSEQTSKIQENLQGGLSKASGIVMSFAGSLGGILGDLLMVILYTFFLLYYRKFFQIFFIKAFPKTAAEKVVTICNKLYEVIKSYLYGLGTVMLIIGVLNTIGLLVLGIQYAWFFGFFASLLMIIPYVGLAFGAVITFVFALATKDNIWYAIGAIGWIEFVQFLEGNIITPNLVGGKVSLNPFISLLSFLIFSSLLGFSGLILALPLTAVIKILLESSDNLKAFGYLLGDPDKELTLSPKQLKKYRLKLAKDKKKPDK